VTITKTTNSELCHRLRAVVLLLCIALSGCIAEVGAPDVPADDEEEEEIIGEAVEALAGRDGFTSYNIYKGIPASSVKCNLRPERFDLMVTAVRRDIFRSTHRVCHKCVKVTSKRRGGGNGESVVVRVIDESNDFSSNGGRRFLDMAPQAFRKIGNLDAGSIPVSFKFVACPPRLE
jgi:hypothetical protein